MLMPSYPASKTSINLLQGKRGKGSLHPAED